MGLLKLVDNVPGVNFYEYRDIDFFNKYKYRARIRFEGLGLTYWTKDITEFVEKLNDGKLRVRRLNKDSVLKNLKTVENFINLRHKIKNDKNITMRMEGDTAGIFSNDLSTLTDLAKIGNIDLDITEAITSQYSGIKYFVRDPKHKYRVYLRSAPIEANFVNDLKETLSKNKNLFPSKSLKAWLYRTKPHTWSFRYCSSAFSIDYDDESTISYLMLIYGNMMGRKFKLEKRPETS